MISPAQAQKKLDRLKLIESFNPSNLCFEKQAAMVTAIVYGVLRSYSVLAGRQAGKSFGLVMASLLIAMLKPGTNQIYVTSTYASCKKMAFAPACAMVRAFGLPATPNRADQSITFKSGSCIYFMGADSEKALGRLRGTPNLVAAFIDEAGIYSPDMLKAMLEAVRPGLRPRAGKLIVAGTPSLDGPSGTFYDITESPDYDQHRFNYTHNDRVPSFADVETLIDEDLRAQGCTRDSAYFQREYLAQFAIELSERLYKFTDAANTYDVLPDNLTHYILGGDTGVKDADGLGVIGWADDDPTIYLVREHIRRGQDVDDLQAVLTGWIEEFNPILVVLDAGANKKAVLTLQNRMPGVPITEAEKPPVNQQIADLNAFLVTGGLKLPANSQAAREIRLPTWLNGVVNGKPQEAGAKKSDIIPGLRYLCLAARPYLPEAKTPEPEDVRKARLALEARGARLAQAQKAAKKGARQTAEDMFGEDDNDPDEVWGDDQDSMTWG